MTRLRPMPGADRSHEDPKGPGKDVESRAHGNDGLITGSLTGIKCGVKTKQST